MLLELVLPPTPTSRSTLHPGLGEMRSTHPPQPSIRLRVAPAWQKKHGKLKLGRNPCPGLSTKVGVQALRPNSCSRTQSVCVQGKS